MRSLAAADLARLRDLRRRLHARPELAGEEAATAAVVRSFLAGCGPAELIEGLGGGHGLAAVFAGRDPAAGPTVVLRAELDALPIRETGEPPHRSTREGVAHLCGHDGHLAMLCGVALALAADPPPRGRVVLVAQPAEETGQGARALVADRRYRALAPDFVFALHNLPGYPLGRVLVRAGAFTAGSVGFIARLRGRTSQAAYPERGASPARAMAELVTGLVTLPIAAEARGELALVTVVHARLGSEAFGTSPGDADVMATLRAARAEVLDELRERAVNLAGDLASRDRLELDVDWVEEFPPVMNHPAAAARAAAAAAAAGLAVAEPDENPFRWSEDFGWFTRRVPGALIGLGAGREQPPLHAGDYDFPDDLLDAGVRLGVALAGASTA